MRGVLDALIVRTSRYYTSARTDTLSANKQNNKNKSCPSSIKSSPMYNNVCDDEVRRFYSRDNSVQAAIAHFVYPTYPTAGQPSPLGLLGCILRLSPYVKVIRQKT
ncbi:hypothetical protein RND71_035668 [Anisodus tanguticus]|uniref:Uncharacterized protein n=1 Tax=Anisodus tanguticus TaxID=243964 RepID=A0AAE1R7E4_9SOLA|nr:hypothetical protein RND71_035668 [Anisodus tanguticus]